ALPTQAEFGRGGNFRRQRIGGRVLIQLRILHRTEGFAVVGKYRELRRHQISNVQLWQGLVVLAIEMLAAVEHIFSFRIDTLVTYARRNTPGTDGDLVIDINSVRIGRIVVTVKTGNRAGERVLYITIRTRIIAAFADVAVTDRHIMRHAVQRETLRVTRLYAEHAIVTW